MQPLLHRFSKRIERAARAEAAAEAAEAAALEEEAFLAGSSDDSSGDEAPLLKRKAEASAAASKPPSKHAQPKNKSKLKLKLKVGGVSHPRPLLMPNTRGTAGTSLCVVPCISGGAKPLRKGSDCNFATCSPPDLYGTRGVV